MSWFGEGGEEGREAREGLKVLMEEEDALSCVTLARTVPAGGVMSLEYGEKAISRLCTVHPEGSHLPRVTDND